MSKLNYDFKLLLIFVKKKAMVVQDLFSIRDIVDDRLCYEKVRELR